MGANYCFFTCKWFLANFFQTFHSGKMLFIGILSIVSDCSGKRRREKKSIKHFTFSSLIVQHTLLHFNTFLSFKIFFPAKMAKRQLYLLLKRSHFEVISWKKSEPFVLCTSTLEHPTGKKRGYAGKSFDKSRVLLQLLQDLTCYKEKQ